MLFKWVPLRFLLGTLQGLAWEEQPWIVSATIKLPSWQRSGGKDWTQREGVRKTEMVSGADAVSDSEQFFIAGHFVRVPFYKPFIIARPAFYVWRGVKKDLWGQWELSFHRDCKAESGGVTLIQPLPSNTQQTVLHWINCCKRIRAPRLPMHCHCFSPEHSVFQKQTASAWEK